MRVWRVLLAGTFCCASFNFSAAQATIRGETVSTSPNSAPQQTESLGDTARRLRSKKTQEVQTTPADAKALFRSVDEIFTFASKDTGFPIRQTVKRRLVSRADVEKETRDRLTKADFADHFSRAELTMKKLGLLPRDFDTREFMVKAATGELAGYYDPDTKMISLVNWISLDQLRPIMAHELTHALQDQNYNLERWAKAGLPGRGKLDSEADESVLSRHAVAEGQAMVVFVDFMIEPYGRNLKNTPGILSNMEDPAVKAVADTEFLHDAPMIMREAGTFPYRDGLIFEGELLQAGGTQMAFAGAFARPPRNTHEVLQPRAYLDKEAIPPVRIPDVKGLLAGRYEYYDGGSMGELDVRAFIEQYGQRRIAESIATKWRGGAYAAFRRVQAGKAPSTADVALLYVSRWKTEKAASEFARIYAATVETRYQSSVLQQVAACAANCPVARAELTTEEGPVIIEQWPNNLVIISESFDDSTATQLRELVRRAEPVQRAMDLPQEELSSSFYEVPAFRQFQARVGEQFWRAMESALSANSPR